MKSNDPLFSLIRSLTQHEKRYIRLYSQQGVGKKESHLQRMFDLLDAPGEYNERDLRDRLKNDPLGRQFAVHKHLLYRSILRSLQAYRYEQSPGMQVRSGIDKVEILLEKGMHAAALKMLLRTRKRAAQFALTSYLIELLNLEKRLMRYLNPLGYLESLPELDAHSLKLVRNAEQESAAVRIYDSLFAWTQVERRMEKKGFAGQLSEIGIRLETLFASAELSFHTSVTLCNARALFRQLTGDYQGMMEAYAEVLRLWDAHPKIKAAYPKRYDRVQIAWLNSALAAGKIGEHLSKIRLLRKMPIQGMAERARIVFQSYNLELLWLKDQKDAQAALAFLPVFEAKMPDLLPYLDDLRRSSYYLNGAFLYFQCRDFRQALSWAHRLQTLDTKHPNTLFFRSAFLISVISQCEIANFSAAESGLRAIGRRLKGRDGDWEFGKLVTEWLRQLVPKWGSPEFPQLKKGFLEMLVEIEEKGAPVPFSLDLLKGWAEE